jgi:hypothetical protein
LKYDRDLLYLNL